MSENFRKTFVSGTKSFAVCGSISVGKSFLLGKLEKFFNDKNSVNKIKEEYPKLAPFINKFKVFYELPDPDILERYYKGMDPDYKDLKPTDVCFDTQMYFLSQRLKILKKKTSHYGLVADDRSWWEDKMFPKMQLKSKFFTPEQYKIYNTFFEEYSKLMPIPNFFIYLDVSPENCFLNLQKRIKKMKLQGFNTSGEERISVKYLTNLGKEYDAWRDEMKKKFGKKFIIIDNNDYVLLDTVLKVINDNL